MRICVMHYSHRYHVVEKLIEDWKYLRIHAPINKLLAELLPECIEVADLYRQTWEYVRELVRTDPNGDEIYEVGKILKPEIPRILVVYQWIQETLAEVNRDGAVLKEAAAFETAEKQVREISAKIETVFPELNEEVAAEALAEFQRGEYQTIEDLIREIQGHSAAAH